MVAMVGSERMREQRERHDPARRPPGAVERRRGRAEPLGEPRREQRIGRLRVVAEAAPLEQVELVALMDPAARAHRRIGEVVVGRRREVGVERFDGEAARGAELHRADRAADPLRFVEREDPVGAIGADLPDDLVGLVGPLLAARVDVAGPRPLRRGRARTGLRIMRRRVAEIVLERVAVPVGDAAAGERIRRCPLLAVVLDLDGEVGRSACERHHLLLARHPAAGDQRDLAAAPLDRLEVAAEEVAAAAALADAEADGVEAGRAPDESLDGVARVRVRRRLVVRVGRFTPMGDGEARLVRHHADAHAAGVGALDHAVQLREVRRLGGRRDADVRERLAVDEVGVEVRRAGRGDVPHAVEVEPVEPRFRHQVEQRGPVVAVVEPPARRVDERGFVVVGVAPRVAPGQGEEEVQPPFGEERRTVEPCAGHGGAAIRPHPLRELEQPVHRADGVARRDDRPAVGGRAHGERLAAARRVDADDRVVGRDSGFGQPLQPERDRVGGLLRLAGDDHGEHDEGCKQGALLRRRA